MDSNRITIEEVAIKAGTSKSTVSRVLNGSAGVREDLAISVKKAVEELGYRPNQVARSLSTRVTFTIGLMINDIFNPFYSAVAKGVEDYAFSKGYSVVLFNTDENEDRELVALKTILDKAVDGIIVAPTGANKAAFHKLLLAGVEIIQVDRRLPNLDASAILIENEAGTLEATKHLIGLGHQNIAFITFDLALPTLLEREQGYCKAMAAANLEIKNHIFKIPFNIVAKQLDTSLKIAHLLNNANPPTGLVTVNNRIGLAVLRAIRDLGLKMPDDVSVVVFDDLEFFPLHTPSISAIAQPAYTMGRKAAELLITQLTKGKTEPNQTIMYRPHLLVRQSSGPPRSR
jgi:LacI family transcriptional regulator